METHDSSDLLLVQKIALNPQLFHLLTLLLLESISDYGSPVAR